MALNSSFNDAKMTAKATIDILDVLVDEFNKKLKKKQDISTSSSSTTPVVDLDEPVDDEF